MLSLPRSERKAAKAAADDLDAQITARKPDYEKLLAREKDEDEMAHDPGGEGRKATLKTVSVSLVGSNLNFAT
jgi:hypothetical protein